MSASPEEVFRAIHAVTAGEIRFFRMPILDLALSSGFVLLSEDWGKSS